jgi:hypothetical protein
MRIPEIRAQMRAFVAETANSASAACPDKEFHATSLRFSVGVGRVSEVLAGRRV